MKHLITLEDIGRLARACYADEDIAASLISEAERQDIKPKVGDALFIRLTQDNTPAGYDVLLDGGEWADMQGNDRYLTGLRTALAYYAYGRIIRDGNIQSTRFGAVVKTEDNSAESERNERARQYREAFTAADGYMMEVLDYLNANTDLFPEYRRTPVKANRSSLRIVDGGARAECRRAQTPAVIAGQPGESAYEIAVANGFRGTVEDWLESLKGEPGANPKGLILEYKAGELTVDELSAIGAVLDTWEEEGRPPLWLQTETGELLPLAVTKDDKGFKRLTAFFSADTNNKPNKVQHQQIYSFDRDAKQWALIDYRVGTSPITTEQIVYGAVDETKLASAVTTKLNSSVRFDVSQSLTSAQIKQASKNMAFRDDNNNFFADEASYKRAIALSSYAQQYTLPVSRCVFGTDCKNNVFYTEGTGSAKIRSNIFGNYCQNNKIGAGVAFCTFGNNCLNNTIGQAVEALRMGSNCQGNVIGNLSSGIVLGDRCQGNKIFENAGSSTSGHSVSLGSGCNGNVIGLEVHDVVFGEDCDYNTIEETASNITFGNRCYGNKIGDSYTGYVYFGDDCNNNSIGRNCWGIILGNNCQGNGIPDDSVNIILGDRVSFISLDIYPSGDQNDIKSNIKILSGIQGQSKDKPLVIAIPERFTAFARNRQIIVASKSTKSYTDPEDLVFYYADEVLHGPVSTDEIQDNAVTHAKIQDSSISTSQLYNYCVTNDKMAKDAIRAQNIVNGAVTFEKIADNAINAPKIIDGAVTTQKLATLAVTTEKIAGRAITMDKIAPNSVGYGELMDNAVITEKIKDGCISTDKLGNYIVTNDKMAKDAIRTQNIVDAAVTIDKIAENSINTPKIQNAAVTTPKMADLAITSEKLAPGAVTPGKIGGAAVGTENIADAAVTETKIADGAITGSKFSPGLVLYMGQQLSYFKQVLVTYGEDPSAAIKSFVQRDYKTAIYIKLSNGLIVPANTNGETVSGLYSYGNTVRKVIYDGTSWSDTEIQSDMIDTAHIVDGAVTGDKIANISITTDKLGMGCVTVDNIAPYAVNSQRIKDGAVIKDKIADYNIVESKFGNGVVSNRVIADKSVTAEKIADGAVTPQKLAATQNLKTEAKEIVPAINELLAKIEELSATVGSLTAKIEELTTKAAE